MLNQLENTLLDLLSELEVSLPVTGMASLQARAARYHQAQEVLGQMNEGMAHLRRRLGRLPEMLIDVSVVQWANTLRTFPNLAFFKTETTGLEKDAEIVRLTLMSLAGDILFDQLVRGNVPLTSHLEEITGITERERNENGLPFAEAYPRFLEATQGKYILSFQLPFHEEKLLAQAKREGLPEWHFLGQCLMRQVMQYLYMHSYPRLATLCTWMNHPLPQSPKRTAIHQLHAQRALFHALADVTLSRPIQALESEDEPLEEHPF